MKSGIVFLCSILCIISCQKKTSSPVPKGDFDYLIGDWERTNEKEGKKTFEHWLQNTEALYTGIGYTLQNKDTIWKEQMQLILQYRYFDDTLTALVSSEEMEIPFIFWRVE